MTSAGNTILVDSVETASNVSINPTNPDYYDKNTSTKCGYGLEINSLSKFLAKGSYGVVYRPSYLYGEFQNCLFDANDHPFLTRTATNYVTKIGITDKMLIEYHEYDSLKTIDPTYTFHYPKPLFIDNKSLNIDVPRGCKDYFQRKYNSRLFLNNTLYTFLIMNDGGESLANYIEDESYLLNFENCVNILNSFTDVFYGVQTLINNRYMHNDLKPQNIVYDRHTGLTKLIDFGLTKNLDKLKLECTNRNNSKTWFNYPIEKFLITYDAWDNIRVILTGNDLNFNTIYDFANFTFNPDSYDDYWYNIFVPHESFPWHREMLGQINNIGNLDPDDNLENIFKVRFEEFLFELKEIFDTEDEDYIENAYDEFLEEYAKKLDVFGIGFSLMCLLSPMKETFVELNIIDIWNDLFSLCLHLINCNMFKRYDIDEAIEEYVHLMEDVNSVMSTGGKGRRGGRIKIPKKKLIREKSELVTAKSKNTNTMSLEEALAKKLGAAPAISDKRKRNKELFKLLDLDPPEKVLKNEEFDKMYKKKWTTMEKSESSSGGKSKKSKKANRKSKRVKKRIV